MAPKIVSDGYVKADSRNLPKLTLRMVVDFFNSSVRLEPEVQHVKEIRSSRASYGDHAVCYVQVKREGLKVCLKGEVTPEHRVRNKGYPVMMELDEGLMKITKAACSGCAASSVICKHVFAFVAWVNRRSETPSVTSVDCYWLRSPLAKVGSTDKFKLIAAMGKKRHTASVLPENLAQFRNLSNKTFQKSGFQVYAQVTNPEVTLSIHRMHTSYVYDTPDPHTVDSFTDFCASLMTVEECLKVAEETKNQALSDLWFEFRYGRVTASKLHEAARCHTEDGSLVATILGAKKFKDTKAMARGRRLEPLVLSKVRKIRKTKVPMQKTGLVLNSAYPMFGASPDGILGEHVVEVKCPASGETYPSYFNNDFTEPAPKYKAQILLQMLLCDKQKGLFCVADPDFENNGFVKIIEVKFDRATIMELITAATEFWRKYVYPKL
nr:PREDICTED: uncharacterized protein LOC109038608 [Bemisia tabaci]